MSDFYPLQIKNIKRHTDKAVQIFFELPNHLKSLFTFTPGQYLTLATHIDNQEYRRSYSICSTSQEDLSVVIKAIPNGVFSNHINKHLKIGDTIKVLPPVGTFVIGTINNNQNYCAFVSGSGITPVMSILKSVLQDNTNSKFVLIYGNKTPIDSIFYKELLYLQEKFEGRLFIEWVFSQTREDNAHFGRIDKSIVNYVINNKYKSIPLSQYLLCGPEPMIDNTKEILLENGNDESTIKFELFYSEKKGNIIENAEGLTSLRVLVDDQEHQLSMQQNEIILDVIINQDIDVPYSCQGGICSSCIAKVKKGKAIMKKNEILTDNEVQDGLILTCQAHPQSKELVLDYDDI